MNDVTCREAAETLDPVMTSSQVATLVWIHVIPEIGERVTPTAGRRARTFSLGDIKRAHTEECSRTSKQFTDSDWVGSALLGRDLIRTDPETGEVRWFNGDRAEKLGIGGYGFVHAGRDRCPAHRIIWISSDGEIAPAMQVNHINQLRWDNRRANLEIVSFGNNIRHAHGTPYISHHDAVRELAELAPQTETANPYGDSLQGGRLIPANKRHGRTH